MPNPPPPDYLAILETLAKHQVDFIVIGGVCGIFHGSPLMTEDVDIVHSRAPENLSRLLAALLELRACYRGQGDRRIAPNLSYLASPGHQLLTTTAGKFDVLGTISGDRGYEELLPHTEEVLLGLDLKVRVLDLPTLIQVKEEVGQDKDKMALPILRRLLDEKNKS
jgi:hypothetical protein